MKRNNKNHSHTCKTAKEFLQHNGCSRVIYDASHAISNIFVMWIEFGAKS